jgi:streptogramin lyase
VRAALVGCLAAALLAAGASAATITEFSQGLPAGASPDALVDGGDGNVWFVDTSGIGRITPDGQITEFPVTLAPGGDLHQVVPGASGIEWFDIVGSEHAIGEVTSAGQVTTFASGTHGLNVGAVPTEMTSGPGGTVWFTDASSTTPAIGRIAADGTITEFPYTGHPNFTFESITEGVGDNIWFTDRGDHPDVGEVTPAGVITTYDLTPGRMPDGLTSGPDGQMWFTDEAFPTAIGHVPAGGPATESSTGLQTNAAPDQIVAGADGNLWFDDQYSSAPALGRITTAGVVTEFPLSGVPFGIVTGIDGNVWATQHQPEAIDRITAAGAVTAFTDGLPGTADLTESDIITGPDGNLWFVDKGTKAIARAAVQLPPTATTGAASVITRTTATVGGTVNARGGTTSVSIQYGGSSALGSTIDAGTLNPADADTPVTAGLSSLPAGATIYYRVVASNAYGTATGAINTLTTQPAPVITNPSPTSRTITTTAGNQRIALVLPSATACTANSATLRPALSVTTLRSGTKLRFASAAFYLDRGIRHVRTVIRRVHGHTKKVKTTFYTANATVRRLPARPSLRLRGLKSGRHTLRVVLVLHRTVTRHGKRTTVSTTRTLRPTFRVC